MKLTKHLKRESDGKTWCNKKNMPVFFCGTKKGREYVTCPECLAEHKLFMSEALADLAPNKSKAAKEYMDMDYKKLSQLYEYAVINVPSPND